MFHLVALTSLAVLVVAAPSKRATSFDTITSDLATVTTDVNTLNSDVQSFDGSLGDALSIVSDADTLNTDLQTLTSDVQSFGTFTDDQGNTILSSLTAIAPTIQSALSGLVAKKSEIADLPIPGATGDVESELQSLNTTIFAFEAAATAGFPADLDSQLSSWSSSVNSEFATAIAAF